MCNIYFFNNPKIKNEEEIGIDYTFCGEKQELMRLMAIGNSMIYLIFSLFMLEIVSEKVFGSWSKVLNRRIAKLYEEHDELFAHILKSMPKS